MRNVKWFALGFCVLALLASIAGYLVLSSYDFNSLKPEISKAVKDATGRELVIGGDIDLKISLTPALIVEDISFANAEWGSRPQMARIKRAEVEVSLLPLLYGELELNRLILLEPDILLETDKDGRSNLAFDAPKTNEDSDKTVKTDAKGEDEPGDKKSSGHGKTEHHAVWIKKLNVQKARLKVIDKVSGQNLELKLEDLSAAASSIDSQMGFSLKGAYNQQPFDLKGELGALVNLLNQQAPYPVKLSGGFAGAKLTLDAKIKDLRQGTGFDIKFELDTRDIAALASLGGGAPPVKGPVRISGRINDPKPKVYRVDDLKLSLAGSDVTGWVQYAAKKLPVLSAELSSQKLDIRPLLAKQADKSGAAKTGAAGSGEGGEEKKVAKPASDGGPAYRRIFPSTPLPLDLMRSMDAHVKLMAKQVLTPSLGVKDLEVGLKLRDGELVVRPLRAKVGGGDFSGVFSLVDVGKQAVMALDLSLKNCRLETILTELGKDKTLEGDLELEISVKGKGRSVAGIMAGLNGRNWVTLKRGKIHNEYVNFAGGDLQAMLLERLNPAHQEKDYTELPCLVQGFGIKNGMAKLSALLVETDQMVILGNGDIDLKSEKLDIGMEPTPKKGVGADEAKLSFSLGELVKPLKLSGTLADPGLGIDVVKAATTIGKSVAGVAMFGGVGALAGLVAGGAEQKDLCQEAMLAAKGLKGKGKTPASDAKQESGQGADKEKPAESLQEGLGEALKGLFN
jgi:uncharacterized protein involved in outer membrane biogenesis